MWPCFDGIKKQLATLKNICFYAINDKSFAEMIYSTSNVFIFYDPVLQSLNMKTAW